MKAYWLTGLHASLDEGGSLYYGTMREAHEIAKANPRDWRAGTRIELVDIEDDKAGILRVLNNQGAYQRVERTWQLTPRGGLKEIANGD